MCRDERKIRTCRALVASLLLLGATGVLAQAQQSGADEPSLKERAHEVGEAVKGAARKVGHASKDAAHQVDEASVKAAHTISSKTKAGYAKAKSRLTGKGEGKEASGGTSR